MTAKPLPDLTFTTRQTERQLVTRVWQKWRFSAPQTHLWLIKHWFSASTFVVEIATFAKPETVITNSGTDFPVDKKLCNQTRPSRYIDNQ